MTFASFGDHATGRDEVGGVNDANGDALLFVLLQQNGYCSGDDQCQKVRLVMAVSGQMPLVKVTGGRRIGDNTRQVTSTICKANGRTNKVRRNASRFPARTLVRRAAAATTDDGRDRPHTARNGDSFKRFHTCHKPKSS